MDDKTAYQLAMKGYTPTHSKKDIIEHYEDFAEGNAYDEYNPDVDDSTAYNINSKGFQKNLTRNDVLKHYQEIATENLYEQALCEKRYKGPFYSAQKLHQLVDESLGKDIKILDVAAGTGLLGEQSYEIRLTKSAVVDESSLLLRLGYTNLYALDPCEGMAAKAKEKNIYKSFIHEFIGSDPLPGVKEDSFDALVMSGGMGQGHVPKEACLEMTRIVKPGGYIVNSMREEYLYSVAEYKDKLEPYMKQLEDEGRWKLIERKIVQEFAFGKTGIVYVHQVTDGTKIINGTNED